jgi:hypothetical protein
MMDVEQHNVITTFIDGSYQYFCTNVREGRLRPPQEPDELMRAGGRPITCPLPLFGGSNLKKEKRISWHSAKTMQPKTSI